MSDPNELFLQWLRDAHAMEEQGAVMLEGLQGRTGDYPDLQSKVIEHLAQTARHAALVRECIERRGGDTSLIKDAAAKVIAIGQNLSGLIMEDEIIKSAMASYTFEHMEISSYTVLIETAVVIGDRQSEKALGEILAQEVAMADWLSAHLGAATRQFLARNR